MTDSQTAIPVSSDPERGFPDSEFEHRLANAHGLMADLGIDALLLTTEAEVRYFTGFHTLFWQSPTRPWFLIVPADSKPVAVVPTIGAAAMSAAFVGEVRSWPSPRPDDDGVSLVIDALDELVGETATIGVPMGTESTIRAPLKDFDQIRDTRARHFVDATNLIKTLRMVKSDAEISRIRRAAQIASQAFDNASNLFHHGLALTEAFRAFKIECLHLGADDIPYLVGAAAPGGYADVISLPTRRPLTEGDVLMLDTGVVYDGYFCDFDRNFSIGSPSDTVQHAHNTLWDATEAGLREARAGVRCQEIFAAMNNVIMRAGYSVDEDNGSDVGRYGHGLGMQLTEWPSMARFDRTELQPNMVVTLEPSLTMHNGLIMVHEENIVIDQQGCQLLSRRAHRDIVSIPD